MKFSASAPIRKPGTMAKKAMATELEMKKSMLTGFDRIKKQKVMNKCQIAAVLSAMILYCS